MKKGLKEWNIRIIISVVSMFLGGSGGLIFASSLEDSHKYQHILESVHYYLQQIYVDPVDEKKLWIGAIRGMMAATDDPYTRFLESEQQKEFAGMEEGKKVGIGVEVTLRGGVPVVIAPVEGGPAMKAGIRSGDRILAIDGKKTERLRFEEMLDLITGENGSVVELEVNHRGMPDNENIKVVRGVFQIDYVKTHYFEKEKVGYIRLTMFFGKEAEVKEFHDALVNFRNIGAKGVILDLRDNSGGHLEMAVQLAGFFLKKGDLVVMARGRDSSGDQDYKAHGETELFPSTTPVVVLINHGSASASEILAGALQDHKRATLVGTRSFGKASVQKIIRPLPDNTAAFITVQRYYTPNNRSIHGKGLDPDVEVKEYHPELADLYYIQKIYRNFPYLPAS